MKKSFLITLGLLVVLPFSLTAATLVIAERGAPAGYVIVQPTGASKSERYAAEELQTYLSESTGVKLRIVDDSHPLPSKAILVGETKYSIALLKDAAFVADSLGEDGFRLAVRSPHLIIFGSSKRGALYGAYEFLERFVGCRWYASWQTVVPPRARVTIDTSLDETQTPSFRMREPFWYDMNVNEAFAAHNKVNGRSFRAAGEKFGGNPYRFGGGLGTCHTFEILVPPKEFFATHPEYFSLIDGHRRADYAQLCLTNPDVLRLVTERVLERIRKDPGAKFYGVSQNDNKAYCQCEACAKIDAEEDSHAGTVVRFVNAVAEAVEREFPDVIIETLAYQHTRKPPKKTRLRHNVVPCLCSIECDFGTPLNTSIYEQNISFCRDIEGWSKQTDELFIWDYLVNFKHYLMPFANFAVLQPNLQYLRSQGAKDMFLQADYQGQHSNFAELKTWLTAKLMWNCDQPLEPLVDDFMTGYYGAAAPYMKRLYEELVSRQAAYSQGGKNPLKIYDDITNPAFTDDFLVRALKCCELAEKAVANDAVRRYNTRTTALAFVYLRLERLRREVAPIHWLSTEAVPEAAREEVARLAVFMTDCIDEAKPHGAFFVSEGHGENSASAKAIAAWRKIAKEGLTPIAPATRGEIEAADILCHRTGDWGDYVDDAQAADGKALKLYGIHHEWCCRYETFNIHFQPKMKYKLRVRARAESVSEGEAFRAGVYNDSLKKSGLPGKGYATGKVTTEYQWFDMGSWEPVAGDYVWISPGLFNADGKSAVSAVYIDKIEFVKE